MSKAISHFKKISDKKAGFQPNFLLGDRVCIFPKHRYLKTSSYVLAPRFLGPYTYLKQMNPVCYKLCILSSLQISNCFHVSLPKILILKTFIKRHATYTISPSGLMLSIRSTRSWMSRNPEANCFLWLTGKIWGQKRDTGNLWKISTLLPLSINSSNNFPTIQRVRGHVVGKVTLRRLAPSAVLYSFPGCHYAAVLRHSDRGACASAPSLLKDQYMLITANFSQREGALGFLRSLPPSLCAWAIMLFWFFWVCKGMFGLIHLRIDPTCVLDHIFLSVRPDLFLSTIHNQTSPASTMHHQIMIPGHWLNTLTSD